MNWHRALSRRLRAGSADDKTTQSSQVWEFVADGQGVDQTVEVREATSVDSLTGMLVRGEILRHLTQRLSVGVLSSVAALFVDIDELKAVNDAYGHAVGDALICNVADRITQAVSQNDVVGRLGGDEFLIVSTIASETGAVQLAERVLEACQAPMTFDRIEIRPSVSIGIALATTSTSTSTDELVADADMAMYQAKRGRSGIFVASDASRLEMKRSIAVNTGLQEAMASRQIHFAYQPILDLETGEILGAEALIRWDHPTFGLIPPPLLIARAEASGQIDQLTEWSLHTICADWTDLRSRWPLFHDKAVSMNLTARQLQWSGYADFHHATVALYGLRPVDIIIEVVESGMIDVDDVAESAVKSLAAQGSIIALDDFGVGYNSLAYFTRFQIDAIKVDRSLVAAGTRDPIARAVLASVFDLGKNLGVHLVGEGIETDAERTMCLDMGITVGQGYLICKPLRLADLEKTMGANWKEWQRRKQLD